ncbi:Addiction module toxin, RelE/StbE [Candidatus Magnetomorum sp. HK-1]|nr:Addiction module toxin, RelE/StbE [Candidatus Magnetomorum sp. HK-1]
MYEIKFHPKVKKDLKKLDPSICKKIRTEHIPKIQIDPEIGNMLTGDLNGTHSYHFKIAKQTYRIAYIVDKINKIIFVQMIGKRGNFYVLLKRRIRF